MVQRAAGKDQVDREFKNYSKLLGSKMAGEAKSPLIGPLTEKDSKRLLKGFTPVFWSALFTTLNKSEPLEATKPGYHPKTGRPVFPEFTVTHLDENKDVEQNQSP